MQDPRVELWEGRTVAEWRRLWGLPQLHVMQSTESTNDVARALAEAGAPAGTLVLAEHQTAGRGTQGRSWHDVPGRSLLFSLLIRPAQAADSAPGTAPIRVGLAVAAALRSCSGVDVGLKWPNDVVCNERKLAGILCEAASAGGALRLVAGVGVNVRAGGEAPPEIRQWATSLEAEQGAAPDRAGVMTAILDALRPLLEAPLAPLSPQERAAYARLDVLHGRAVLLSGEPRFDSGIARGVAADGALLLETRGTVARVTSATVRLQRHATPTHQRP